MTTDVGSFQPVPASKPLSFVARNEFLRYPVNAAFYLTQILQTDNVELFQEALRTVASVQGLPEQAPITREL